MPRLVIFCLLCAAAWSAPARAAQPAPREPSRWWKGNLHTHSLWSDGDDFPESIVDSYRTNGYHFLALSDHNIMPIGDKRISVTNATRQVALEKYRARFGDAWVAAGANPVAGTQRLRTLAEYRGLFEAPGRFLLIPSEEITDKYKLLPVHMNVTNLRELIEPRGGSNVTDVIQRNLAAVLAQRQRTGQPMFAHLNHPNYGWGVTAEDLMGVGAERFFEVYNGHPAIHNRGDEHHAGTERIWDIMLAFRLTSLKLGLIYGLAVDDSHNYHKWAPGQSNTGRGWVVVRAAALRPELLIPAMEAGEFYASTGVRLKEVRRDARGISIEIEAEPGVEYSTQFIGTLRGFDPTSRPGPRPTNSIYAVTRTYAESIGAVLGVQSGPRVSYAWQGDELYVRAKVTSTRLKPNAPSAGEVEVAWTQPAIGPGRERVR